jgi:hypothetical protein
VLRKKRIAFGWHFTLKEKSKLSVNSKSFSESVKSTLIPHVARILAGREIEEEGIIFMIRKLSE